MWKIKLIIVYSDLLEKMRVCIQHSTHLDSDTYWAVDLRCKVQHIK